jgi:hypothetical protein
MKPQFPSLPRRLKHLVISAVLLQFVAGIMVLSSLWAGNDPTGILPYAGLVTVGAFTCAVFALLRARHDIPPYLLARKEVLERTKRDGL